MRENLKKSKLLLENIKTDLSIYDNLRINNPTEIILGFLYLYVFINLKFTDKNDNFNSLDEYDLELD